MAKTLIEARMAVSNVGHSVAAPGNTEPNIESLAFQGMPPVSTKEVPSVQLSLAIAAPDMMNRIQLGKTYRLLIVEDDGG